MAKSFSRSHMSMIPFLFRFVCSKMDQKGANVRAANGDRIFQRSKQDVKFDVTREEIHKCTCQKWIATKLTTKTW